MSFLPIAKAQSLFSTQAKPSLISLPVEIRLHIITLIFTDISPPPRLLVGQSAALVPQLCLMNHQLSREALPIYIQSVEYSPASHGSFAFLSQWLDHRPGGHGYRYVRALDLEALDIRAEDASWALEHIARCRNLKKLIMRVDCREVACALPIETIVDIFHLDELLSLGALRMLTIVVLDATHMLPPDPLESFPEASQNRTT